MTGKGRDILKQLDKVDPTEHQDLYKQLATAILEDIPLDTPTQFFAIEQDFAEKKTYKYKPLPDIEGPTEKGRTWLWENHEVIYKKGGKQLREWMIPYLGIKYLAGYLSSDDEEIRERARNRFEELRGRRVD